MHHVYTRLDGIAVNYRCAVSELFHNHVILEYSCKPGSQMHVLFVFFLFYR